MAVTLVAFVGSIAFTVYLSFTNSRRLPSYDFVGLKQYERLFTDDNWWTALENMLLFAAGSLASIVLGFLLAAIIDKEIRGASVFRTIFLYPLSISLIVTGIAWRWLFEPGLGIESYLRSVGITWINFHWLTSPNTVMAGVTLAAVWQNAGFFMALMISGLKGINPEIWRAGRLDGVPFWRFYLEIIIPMMRFTFLTCAILMSIGVVRAYDIIVAMTRGGPGTSSYLPAFFTVSAYWDRLNLAYGSAAATLMLVITLALFIPVLIQRLRRRSA
jgi:glucose/mannose transport system permease protein